MLTTLIFADRVVDDVLEYNNDVNNAFDYDSNSLHDAFVDVLFDGSHYNVDFINNDNVVLFMMILFLVLFLIMMLFLMLLIIMIKLLMVMITCYFHIFVVSDSC